MCWLFSVCHCWWCFHPAVGLLVQWCGPRNTNKTAAWRWDIVYFNCSEHMQLALILSSCVHIKLTELYSGLALSKSCPRENHKSCYFIVNTLLRLGLSGYLVRLLSISGFLLQQWFTDFSGHCAMWDSNANILVGITLAWISYSHQRNSTALKRTFTPILLLQFLAQPKINNAFLQNKYNGLYNIKYKENGGTWSNCPI